METTPIYDAVEAELDIHPADLVRPPWSFAERDSAIRRLLVEQRRHHGSVPGGHLPGQHVLGDAYPRTAPQTP